MGASTALIAASCRPLLGSYGVQGLFGGILAASVVLIVGLRLSNRLSRRMEHQADARAAEAQASAGVYARALERLYETNLLPAVQASKRTTHPDLYDRMIQAGLNPDYPRPAPPPRGAGMIGWGTLLLALVAARSHVQDRGPRPPRGGFRSEVGRPVESSVQARETRGCRGDPRARQGGVRGPAAASSPRLSRADSSPGTAPAGGSRSRSG